MLQTMILYETVVVMKQSVEATERSRWLTSFSVSFPPKKYSLKKHDFFLIIKKEVNNKSKILIVSTQIDIVCNFLDKFLWGNEKRALEIVTSRVPSSVFARRQWPRPSSSVG